MVRKVLECSKRPLRVKSLVKLRDRWRFFFDTRYALCKGKYEIGKTYKFRLAAFAYDAQVLPDKDREFRIPMIARKSLFDAVPETDDPVRGMLWLQGYCAETLEEKDQDR